MTITNTFIWGHDYNKHNHINATESSIPETVILRAKFLLLQLKPDRMVPNLKLFAQFRHHSVYTVFCFIQRFDKEVPYFCH
jgi:hypothetical protein